MTKKFGTALNLSTYIPITQKILKSIISLVVEKILTTYVM